MPDGHVNKCKECNKKDVRENRHAKNDYYNAYDRIRSQLPHRKENNRKRSRRSRKNGNGLVNNEKYLSKFPKRRSAHIAVGNAIRDGKLIKQPCFVCGKVEVEAHHPDYDQPLEVVWLCIQHHKEVHKKYDRDKDIEFISLVKDGSIQTAE